MNKKSYFILAFFSVNFNFNLIYARTSCAPSNCGNKGSCRLINNRKTCHCESLWTGYNCGTFDVNNFLFELDSNNDLNMRLRNSLGERGWYSKSCENNIQNQNATTILSRDERQSLKINYLILGYFIGIFSTIFILAFWGIVRQKFLKKKVIDESSSELMAPRKILLSPRSSFDKDKTENPSASQPIIVTSRRGSVIALENIEKPIISTNNPRKKVIRTSSNLKLAQKFDNCDTTSLNSERNLGKLALVGRISRADSANLLKQTLSVPDYRKVTVVRSRSGNSNER